MDRPEIVYSSGKPSRWQVHDHARALRSIAAADGIFGKDAGPVRPALSLSIIFHSAKLRVSLAARSAPQLAGQQPLFDGNDQPAKSAKDIV